jgi:F-type H+-transporting ATPase subunit b
VNITSTLFAQLVVFAILSWFTAKYVWPPITKALDERAKKIADGLAAAERGKQDLAQAEARAAQADTEARTRAQEIVANAEKRAAEVVEEAKATAKAEADRIVAAAKAEVDQEVARARDVLRQQVAGLAVSGAERILRQEVDAAKHAAMLADLERELVVNG